MVLELVKVFRGKKIMENVLINHAMKRWNEQMHYKADIGMILMLLPPCG